ncbi:DMSO/selenate family reductase complex A subunit [Sporomusa acidovorans]|uniref:Dimethyl sulfoxide reductase chain YnfF n=1 Tax=Sporomusa acidovorans (strain ATCC 49682 / DSM 3132 / Mol) TaxID=1123286 RepID=A0ABZ3J6Y5_SPOA4|nr:DMSO/selenate family reductase complex A subunit [Sporomusa acidovorans]OZC24286.1 putative dimethyl sulfoxide reductase chain YnfF precursor [Sporomusa acidovorans DSM 3132]SDF02960.1 anaerobic dimethyl sulfoxide reductase subunit A [Sporomusa acidovorans]
MYQITRRNFLKLSGALAGTAFIASPTGYFSFKSRAAAAPVDDETHIVPVVCNHNCGGRCQLKAYVRNGKIIRLITDDSPDTEKMPQLRACLRGRSTANRLYHPNRLKYPMKRVGKRGEGKFERISWDEATSLIAQNLREVLDKYGNHAVYIQYGTGDRGAVSGRFSAFRLMNLLGGYLSYYNSYSSACANYAAPYILGKELDNNGYDTLVYSKLIILNGFNPAETVFETNSNYWLAKAKAAGAKIIVIDPRYSETAATFADQWIPIKPTTDTALFVAMAYVIIQENLQDQAFLDNYCLGFDEAHMPEGVPAGNSFNSYVLGVGDGQPKTPEWAEAITGIGALTIRQLARDYATIKPAQLMQGLGPQRHAQGELSVRMGAVLAAMTGNIGKLGGGSGTGEGGRKNSLKIKTTLPVGTNPVKASIPVFLWTDAVVRGTEMTAADGVKNGPLTSNIKFIWNMASNTLINQHSDINKTIKILQDENLIQFIVASDHFITPSLKFADVILPSDHAFERDDLGYPWSGDQYVVLGSKAVEAPGECKRDYWWISQVADKMGIGVRFTEGKSDVDWLKQIVADAQKSEPGFPSWEELKQAGCFKKEANLHVAYAKQISDSEKYPFKTPSGKIEIFSKTLFAMNHPEIPGVPKYIAAWEGPSDPLIEKFPLQCIGPHIKRRTHSIFDETPWLEEAEGQTMWMHPDDAAVRGISNGSKVKVFNDRGALIIPVQLTQRIRPGVVAIPQGAWYTPDAAGVCQRGCINILTSQRPTPLAHGNAQHTLLVQVTKL